jgi:uncharacterized protein YodC (DUF2158 family)
MIAAFFGVPRMITNQEREDGMSNTANYHRTQVDSQAFDENLKQLKSE